jgi:hypothetical protein
MRLGRSVGLTVVGLTGFEPATPLGFPLASQSAYESPVSGS